MSVLGFVLHLWHPVTSPGFVCDGDGGVDDDYNDALSVWLGDLTCKHSFQMYLHLSGHSLM